MKGTVKWFNRKKGYGFIKGDDDQDYFVHNTALASGTVLQENDKVSFEPIQSDRGKQAQSVIVEGQEEQKDQTDQEEQENQTQSEE